MKGGSRVARSDGQHDPASIAADDKGIGDDPSRRQGGRSACSCRGEYRSSGGAAAAGLHNRGGGGGKAGTPNVRVACFMDDTSSVVMPQWQATGRCQVPLQALALGNQQAIGERAVEEEPLLSHLKVVDWVTRREVLGFDPDTERTKISLPDRKINDLRNLLEEWPKRGTSRHTAGPCNGRQIVPRGVRDHTRAVFLAAAYPAGQPVPHLAGRMGGRGGWRWGRKKAETRNVLDLTAQYMPDLKWRRWCPTKGLAVRGEELAAPLVRLMKQLHRRTWFLRRIIREGKRAVPGDRGVLEV